MNYDHRRVLSVDDNPRPLKRQRQELLTPQNYDSSPIPQNVLLLTLPSILIHPPSHHLHTQSLLLSKHALRKCLTFQNGGPITECKVWTALAEIGLAIGLETQGVENEVEIAITKALLIAQKQPALRWYTPHLTILSTRLAQFRRNHKYAQNSLRRLISFFLHPSDPPHIVYSIHLNLIASLGVYDAARHLKSLGAIQELHNVANTNGHTDIARLASVLRLQALVSSGQWDDVSDTLTSVEKDLCMKFEVSVTNTKTSSLSENPRSGSLSEPLTRTPLVTVMIIHALIIGIAYYTYAGDANSAITRLKKLHEMLDGGALKAFGDDGVIECMLSENTNPSLFLQVTHPRIIYALVFLVSSVAKRDPVGRNPKKRVFAVEGLSVVDKEMRKELKMPIWSTIADMDYWESKMNNIKADLMCELVTVSIMRSEFDSAEESINDLIAYTRSYHIFGLYSARIALLQAQLAHASTKPERAIQCYQVAAYLSRRRTQKPDTQRDSENVEDSVEDLWVNVCARAGELWIRLGLLRQGKAELLCVENTSLDSNCELERLRIIGGEVIRECRGLGGTLSAVGDLLDACLAKEFLKAKNHLRRALNEATKAQDNHLRALILPLIASHYLHTATDHAQTMLVTADQLAAGLGAQPRSSTRTIASQSPSKGDTKGLGSDLGNVQLRLWIGNCFLELNKWEGDEKKVQRQILVNAKLQGAVNNISRR